MRPVEAVGSEAPSRTCAECKGKGYLVTGSPETGGARPRAVARVCRCMRECRHCEGQGFVYTTREETFSAKMGARVYDALAPCVCRVLRTRVERYDEVGVPGVHARATLEGYRSSNEAGDRAKQVVLTFAQNARRGQPSRGFILSGPVGTGKTHLLSAALGHLVLETGIRARYQEISLLYADIRRGFQEGKSGGEIIGPLSDVDVLAIDELGRGRGSAFELETLDELIARRYNAGRTTLFATNYSLEPERGARATSKGYRAPDDAAKPARDSELLRERVGERIYSRLCEMCEFVQLPPETRDYRRTRGELHGKNKSRAV